MKINRLIIINAAESYRALNKILQKYFVEYDEKFNEIENLRFGDVITSDEFKKRIKVLNEEYKDYIYAEKSISRYSYILNKFGVERYVCDRDKIDNYGYCHCKDVDEILKTNGNIIDDERPLYYEDFKRA